MNPHTGAVYPGEFTSENYDSPSRMYELMEELRQEDPDDLVEVSGEREALLETIEALQDRAKSMGSFDDRGMSKREIRRHLERQEAQDG